MEAKKNLACAPHSVAQAIKISIVLFISMFIFSILGTTSFAKDYYFNGEIVHEKSSRYHNYYGVETITNILDDLGLTYDDNTKVSYTYYTNQALKYLQENVDETIGIINICFFRSSYEQFCMIPSNGSFSNTLNFLYINQPPNATSSIPITYFDSWVKDGERITHGNEIKGKYCTINTNNYSYTNNKAYFKGGTNELINTVQVKWQYLLAPEQAFAYAGTTKELGWGWYFVGKTIRFSEEPTNPSGDIGGGTSGDNSGDTGGGSSSVDLTMTNEKIDELNKKAEEIKNKIPTSGEVQNIVGQETDKIIGFMSGEPTKTEDDFMQNMPNVEVDDPTEDFFTWLFNQIAECFTVSTNQTLTFTIYGEEFKINSDDYILNVPILKNVIGKGMGIFIFYAIFKDIRREIEKVKEGKFSDIANEDITANMM